MKHIKTVNKANLKETAAKGGCGRCQTSCQSACKTSCTVANQKCEALNKKGTGKRKALKAPEQIRELLACLNISAENRLI